jgi:hypothetical protein
MAMYGDSSCSDYFLSLANDSKKRYLQKVSLINGKDPYTLKKSDFSQDKDDFPNFQYPDLYHYLIHTSSFITAEEVKNYKSLEAYKYFVDGWVLETGWLLIQDVFLLVGKVKHSYAISSTPLKPWVLVRKSGTVECGHCTCMAGLAETCSHVAAILYWLETAVRIKAGITCTSQPNAWLPQSMPSARLDVPYVTLEALEELAGSRKKATPSSGQVWSDIKQKSPTEEDLEEFFANLSTVTDRKPAILSVVPTYNEAYAKSSQHLPPMISDRYDPQNLSLNYHQLLEKTETLCQQPLTESQIMHLEEVTRGQSNNKLWFKHRGGRITASQLHQVRYILYVG